MSFRVLYTEHCGKLHMDEQLALYTLDPYCKRSELVDLLKGCKHTACTFSCPPVALQNGRMVGITTTVLTWICRSKDTIDC